MDRTMVGGDYIASKLFSSKISSCSTAGREKYWLSVLVVYLYEQIHTLSNGYSLFEYSIIV